MLFLGLSKTKVVVGRVGLAPVQGGPSPSATQRPLALPPRRDARQEFQMRKGAFTTFHARAKAPSFFPYACIWHDPKQLARRKSKKKVQVCPGGGPGWVASSSDRVICCQSCTYKRRTRLFPTETSQKKFSWTRKKRGKLKGGESFFLSGLLPNFSLVSSVCLPLFRRVKDEDAKGLRQKNPLAAQIRSFCLSKTVQFPSKREASGHSPPRPGASPEPPKA